MSKNELTTVDAEVVSETDAYETMYFDDKGRRVVSQMSQRELLEEMVTSQRQLADLVEGFMSSMDKNPMMRMFAGKLNGGK